jgi:3-deoxy-7-phosphoheptulonate synthase
MDIFTTSGTYASPITTLLADRERCPAGTIVDISGVLVGGAEIVVMAGPCAVETRDQILRTALAVKGEGARVLRGGAFKPRTAPYSFRGLQEEGLELLALARQETGMPVVTEVMDARQVEQVCEHADALQIGSRNMHNYPLLDEVGLSKKPVLLKRGMSATIQELVFAAEYILKQGNENVMLCERGIRTFENSTRNTLDLSAVPMLKKLTHLPVVVDPSHAAGKWWMVPPLAKAAVAVGADGLLVEVHCDPTNALSDGEQSLRPDHFQSMMAEIRAVALAVGRNIAAAGTKAD